MCWPIFNFDTWTSSWGSSTDNLFLSSMQAWKCWRSNELWASRDGSAYWVKLNHDVVCNTFASHLIDIGLKWWNVDNNVGLHNDILRNFYQQLICPGDKNKRNSLYTRPMCRRWCPNLVQDVPAAEFITVGFPQGSFGTQIRHRMYGHFWMPCAHQHTCMLVCRIPLGQRSTHDPLVRKHPLSACSLPTPPQSMKKQILVDLQAEW